MEVSAKPLHWFSSFYTCFSAVLEVTSHTSFIRLEVWCITYWEKKIILYASFFSPWQYIHVLVCPKCEVKRFADLSSDETSDLWVTAKEVGVRLEQYHKASSLTFAIQVWYMLQFYCCSELILSVLNDPNLCNTKVVSYLNV